MISSNNNLDFGALHDALARRRESDFKFEKK